MGSFSSRPKMPAQKKTYVPPSNSTLRHCYFMLNSMVSNGEISLQKDGDNFTMTFFREDGSYIEKTGTEICFVIESLAAAQTEEE